MEQQPDRSALKRYRRQPGHPFNITKIGHVVLHCRDIEASVRFYTEILGFEVSDIYPDDMVPGGMAFLRCNADHHGIALVGAMKAESEHLELNHLAFAVATLDEVFHARAYLKQVGVALDFDGRRRAGAQIAIEFRDPDGHRLEIYWGLDQIGSDGHIRPASQWKWAHSLEEAVADPAVGQDTSLRDPSLLQPRSAAEAEANRRQSEIAQTAKLSGR